MLPHPMVINPNLAQFGTFERRKTRIHSKWRERKWHKTEVSLNMPYKRRPKSLKHRHRQWPQFDFIDFRLGTHFLIRGRTCHNLYDQLTFTFSLLLNT